MSEECWNEAIQRARASALSMQLGDRGNVLDRMRAAYKPTISTLTSASSKAIPALETRFIDKKALRAFMTGNVQ